MSTVTDVMDQAVDTLVAGGLRAVRASGEVPTPPCAVVGLPTLEWQGYDPGPSAIRVRVVLLADAGPRIAEQLGDLLDQAKAAIDGDELLSMTRADSVPYTSPGGVLPAYDLTLEVTQ